MSYFGRISKINGELGEPLHKSVLVLGHEVVDFIFAQVGAQLHNVFKNAGALIPEVDHFLSRLEQIQIIFCQVDGVAEVSDTSLSKGNTQPEWNVDFGAFLEGATFFKCLLLLGCSHLGIKAVKVVQVVSILLELAGNKLLLGQDVVNVPVVALLDHEIVSSSILLICNLICLEILTTGQKHGI